MSDRDIRDGGQSGSFLVQPCFCFEWRRPREGGHGHGLDLGAYVGERVSERFKGAGLESPCFSCQNFGGPWRSIGKAWHCTAKFCTQLNETVTADLRVWARLDLDLDLDPNSRFTMTTRYD